MQELKLGLDWTGLDLLIPYMPLWITGIVCAELSTLLPMLETPGLWRAEGIGALRGAVAWIVIV